jgi:hypothetical protein
VQGLTQIFQLPSIARMTNCISVALGAVGIRKILLTKARRAKPSPPPAGDKGTKLNLTGVTMAQVTSMDMRTRMATMQMQKKWTMHCKPLMDERNMWATEYVVRLTC